MEKSSSERLAEILARNTKAEASATEAAARVKEEERQKERDRLAAADHWAVSRRDLNAAVSEINKALAAQALELRATDKKPPVAAALAKVAVALWKGDKSTNAQVVFNIGAFGLVQPIMMVPHTGKLPATFNISSATQASYEEVLLSFLDQYVANLEKTPTSFALLFSTEPAGEDSW